MGLENTILLTPTLDLLGGLASWSLSFLLPILCIYAVLVLALNVQWGYIGIFNFGVVAFFLVGAYATAILIAPPDGEFKDYIYVFQALVQESWPEWAQMLATQLLIPVAWLGGMLAAALLAAMIVLPVLRLREDYLAIVTIGIAEILRTVAKSTAGLVNQGSGISSIPRLASDYVDSVRGAEWVVLLVLVAVLVLVFGLLWALMASPWGRTLRALRDSEGTARSVGKRIVVFRIQAFVLGAAVMGLAGGLYATSFKAVSPSLFQDLTITFLAWTMLIVGGSGNHRGALLGALLIGTLWFGVDQLQSALPFDISANLFVALRQLLIGLLIVLFMIFRPAGIIPERARISRFIPRKHWG